MSQGRRWRFNETAPPTEQKTDASEHLGDDALILGSADPAYAARLHGEPRKRMPCNCDPENSAAKRAVSRERSVLSDR